MNNPTPPFSDFDIQQQTSRPYYNPETFNAGYVAVFKPKEGVTDPRGHTLASKLKIVQKLKQNETKSGSSSLIGGGNSSTYSLFTGIPGNLEDRSTSNASNNKSLHDLELADLLNFRTWERLSRQILNKFIRQYFRHLIQQPFDVSRLLMQVGEFDAILSNKNGDNDDLMLRKKMDHDEVLYSGQDKYNEVDAEDYEEEDVEYFLTPSSATIRDAENGNKKLLLDENNNNALSTKENRNMRVLSVVKNDEFEVDFNNDKTLKPKVVNTTDILNAIVELEGLRGLWRANHTSFVLNFLASTLDAWFTGFFSPFLSIPDPYFVDIIHSNNIQKSIILSLAASIMTGIILLPLDLIRTRLIICRLSSGDRSLRQWLKKWSWKTHFQTVPLDMMLLNVTNSVICMFFNKKLINVFLYYAFNLDQFGNTLIYSTGRFLVKVCELFIKLPLECIYRRCQVSYLCNENRSPFYISQPKHDLSIKPVPYLGILNCINFKNNSIIDLWRGWRIGFLSIVCGYGVKLLKYTDDTSLLREEKF
ncbi:related to Mitochondrial fusion and transport protein UGO1 [Saccharomycodes ludwigii]|uniref:Related to Mitochondrial fusion and transport protein UGO1 n=1 Tax=Saccharomycodes ludwigii TaxID=36035 RepID=A0A376B7K3_9ASCO|nr:related to Mitochondrial fusion and transport protein UGO1 [Saccharomycodes ludwigii]